MSGMVEKKWRARFWRWFFEASPPLVVRKKQAAEVGTACFFLVLAEAQQATHRLRAKESVA